MIEQPINKTSSRINNEKKTNLQTVFKIEEVSL